MEALIQAEIQVLQIADLGQNSLGEAIAQEPILFITKEIAVVVL